MPAEVDVQERLAAIAEATLQLARSQGTPGVTVRAVARKLGGSTTLVTKYLPTRVDLLRNAFSFVSDFWDRDLEAALDGREGMDKLRALADWSLQTVGYDDAMRRLWIEAMAGNSPDDEAPSTREAEEEHESILEIVEEAGQEEWVADALFLAFRGYYLSSIEDPEGWPSERAQEAIRRMLDSLGADSP